MNALVTMGITLIAMENPVKVRLAEMTSCKLVYQFIHFDNHYNTQPLYFRYQ